MLDGTTIFGEIEEQVATVFHFGSHFRFNGILTTRWCAKSVDHGDEYVSDWSLVTCRDCHNVKARRQREDLERQAIIDRVRGHQPVEIFQ